MDIQTLTTDSDLEDGVWLNFEGEDASFLIASTNRPEYSRAMNRAVKRIGQHKITAKPELATDATIEAMADAVLLDWKGLTANGVEFPCTRENRVKLLKSSRVLREWVSAESSNLTNFQREAMAADAEAVKSGDPVGAESGGAE